ncbi:hypothetical protein DES47_10345 [Roseateles toxinivorans]|uniref:Uncharacterized protein n=1 Tax=Roseateles toxinivorans TaxID=270368 RepID=A0A4V3CT97_9BURK|nr:hypothetical protein DES47_10345 [Roseateles toxinivorans]
MTRSRLGPSTMERIASRRRRHPECGAWPCGPSPLRCSRPEATRPTRPRTPCGAGICRWQLPVLGAQTKGARPIAWSDGQPHAAALLGAAKGVPSAPARNAGSVGGTRLAARHGASAQAQLRRPTGACAGLRSTVAWASAPRRAIPHLTGRDCPNIVSEANGVSFAPGPRREHRARTEGSPCGLSSAWRGTWRMLAPWLQGNHQDPRTEARRLAGLGLCRDKPNLGLLTAANSAWLQGRA